MKVRRKTRFSRIRVREIDVARTFDRSPFGAGVKNVMRKKRVLNAAWRAFPVGSLLDGRESMPPWNHRWQRCAPVPAHMCKDGCPRGRTVGAFAHVRVSLSRSQRCAFVTTRRRLKSHRADTRDSRGEEQICADDPATVSNVWRNVPIFFLC